MKMLYPFLAVLCLGLLGRSLEAVNRKKIGFWSTWNISCGIAMYSKHIADSLCTLGHEVLPYDYHLAPDEIVARAGKDALNILMIQYDRAIMPPTDILVHTMRCLRNKGVKVVITFHAEPEYAQELVDAAHAALYHKQPQCLKSTHKVTVLPMGIPVFTCTENRALLRQKYGFNLHDKILVSTGFLLPSKEIDIILEHLAPTLNHDHSIKLQLLHAFNAFTSLNPEPCQQAYNRILAVIQKYQLHDQVRLITDFIPQQELSERIHVSDLGYQWFCADTKGTSASAKEYISARTPLVIPDFSHFHDMHYHGIKVTPCNHEDFAQSILHLLYQPRRLHIMRHHLEKVYQQFNYANIIKKYDAVLQAL